MATSKFNGFVKTIPGSNTLNYLHEELGKRGVKVVYEKAPGFDEDRPVYTRIMFGTFSRSCTFDFPGVVLARDGDGGYRVVSAPPAPPVTQYQAKHLHNNFHPDSVIRANDGTTVTLYHHAGRWVISTHRGFEVNGYDLGDGTYQGVVDGVLAKYPGFSYAALDTGKSYTFGFKHESVHPFIDAADGKGGSAWFIQSSDIAMFNAGDDSYISYTEDIGLPLQVKVAFPSMKQLFQSANGAYEAYKKTGVVNYGYLIRIKGRAFLVESSLLCNIRKIFYSNKFHRLDVAFDKRKYITTNAFLDPTCHAIFRTLFPQFIPVFLSLEKKVDELVGAIVQVATEGDEFKQSTMVDTVAYELHSQICDKLAPHKTDPSAMKGVAYSYIYDVKFTSMVYKISGG